MNADAVKQFFAQRKVTCDCRVCWPEATGFVICPSCGCKRCPKATFHEHECTRSNLSGQIGSTYGETMCGKPKCKCVKLAAQQEVERQEFIRDFPNFGSKQ